MFEAIYNGRDLPPTTQRQIASAEMKEALAAGTFQLTEVLSAGQPARDRAMEVLTDTVQVRSVTTRDPHGIGHLLRIYVRVTEMRDGRTPLLVRSKERMIYRDKEVTGEKTWKNFKPGTYLLSLKDALAMLTKHGVGIIDSRGLRSGVRRACATEVGYEFDGRRYNTEHLAKRPTTVVASRLEDVVSVAEEAALPSAGAPTDGLAALPPPVAEKPSRKQHAA